MACSSLSIGGPLPAAGPLRFTWRLVPALAFVLGAPAFATDTGPPPGVRLPAVLGGFPPPQAITGVPDAHPRPLRLAGVPKASGPRVLLFNGTDLSEFTPWLGYANGTMFPTDEHDRPLGERGIGDQFRVVQEEGAPAIYIVGKVWGSINTRRDLGDYHLHLQFKYGRQWMADPPNSGVLFHSYGPYGAFAGTWMSAIEFEMQTGALGLMIPIGRDVTTQVELGKAPGPGLFGGDNLQYYPGGKAATVRLPTPVRQGVEGEKPLGQWNELDLYAAGDRAVFVVNGLPVMALSHIALVGGDGASHPLTHGRVQLESEGAEVYLRDLWYEPIASVPEVVPAP